MGASEPHVHAALVQPEAGVTPRLSVGGFSLLRASVPMRLVIVAVAACLLWAAVFWALA